MDTGYKIYAEWLRTRLEKEMNEKISIEQNAIRFRKEKGTIEAIYVLTKIIEENISKDRGKVYILCRSESGRR